jgi:hypothetical protein
MPDAAVHCRTPLGLRTQEMPAGRAVRARADEVMGIAAQYDVRFV